MIRPLRLVFFATVSLSILGCGQLSDSDNPPTDDPVIDEPENDDPAPDDPIDPEPPVENLRDPEGREFSYVPTGDLLPNSGPGYSDLTVYRSEMLFPLEDSAFLNSQVYRHGGSQGAINGMTGGQCHETNYDYPWQDTFCESRGRSQIMCPEGGHEGVDIRPAGCIPETNGEYWAIAAEDGRIVGLANSKYTVKLQTDDGTIYRYLHLKMDELAVSDGQFIAKGQRIGKVSNDFFNSAGEPVPTTFHMHFEMYQNYAPDEETEPVFDQVNPYMTLVNAYERKLRNAD